MIFLKRLWKHILPIPKAHSEYAAGLDLCADDNYEINPGERVLVGTGFAFHIPAGHAGIIKPRSGLAVKHGIDVMAGVIDSDYRGEIKILLINHGQDTFNIFTGQRIAQLLIIEVPFGLEVIETDELPESARGDGGFGSTGTN